MTVVLYFTLTLMLLSIFTYFTSLMTLLWFLDMVITLLYIIMALVLLSLFIHYVTLTTLLYLNSIEWKSKWGKALYPFLYQNLRQINQIIFIFFLVPLSGLSYFH